MKTAYAIFTLLLLQLSAVYSTPVPLTLPPHATTPVWGTIRADNPLTTTFEELGVANHIYWTTVQPTSGKRFFLSNHPESLGQRINNYGWPVTVGGEEWPPRNNNYILWQDLGQDRGSIEYRILVNHQKFYPATVPIYIGVVVENIGEEPIVVSGNWTGFYGSGPYLDWTTGGEVNSYMELMGNMPHTISATTPIAKDEKVLLPYWMMIDYGVINVHMSLLIDSIPHSPEKVVRCKVKTILTFQDPAMTIPGEALPVFKKPMTLITHHGPHPRGTWCYADQLVNNFAKVYDIGTQHGVKKLPLHSAIGSNPGSKQFSEDITHTGGDPGSGWNHPIGSDIPAGHSYNSRQSSTNTGMYGVTTSGSVRVKNSSDETKTLLIHCIYMSSSNGSFNGALQIQDNAGNWITRRLHLQRSFVNNTTTTQGSSPLATAIIESYPIPANCEGRDIRFNIMTDGPAMLPIGIVLRRQ